LGKILVLVPDPDIDLLGPIYKIVDLLKGCEATIFYPFEVPVVSLLDEEEFRDQIKEIEEKLSPFVARVKPFFSEVAVKVVLARDQMEAAVVEAESGEYNLIIVYRIYERIGGIFKHEKFIKIVGKTDKPVLFI